MPGPAREANAMLARQRRERLIDQASINVRLKMLAYPHAWEASRGYWRKQRAGVTHLDYRLVNAIRAEFARLSTL